MYPRTEYQMTQEDMEKLLESMKPVPMIMLQCGEPRSQQENANAAWAELGARMGFDWNTVQSISGKGSLFFSAVPNEPEDIKAARLAKEAELAKQKKIAVIEAEIAAKKSELESLLAA